MSGKFKMFHLNGVTICNQTSSYRFIVATILDDKSNISWC